MFIIFTENVWCFYFKDAFLNGPIWLLCLGLGSCTGYPVRRFCGMFGWRENVRETNKDNLILQFKDFILRFKDEFSRV